MVDPINLGMVWPYYLAAFAAAYLLGSIPFGLLLTRLAGLGDVRSIGSGNIGATNVLRTGNKGLALATLLLDGGKGAVAVLIAKQFGDEPTVMAALGVFLGHLFPVWLGFKGGKGVATFLGINLALAVLTGVLVCATWLAVAFASRFSSLSALVAAAAAPLYLWLLGPSFAYAQVVAVLAVLVWIAHRANIARLWAGTEPRIGDKSSAPPAKAG